jgi:polyisoprenoid-binding protein YceI
MSRPATQVEDIQQPTAGDYRIDTGRSTVSFGTRHLFGLAPVRGTFTLRDGHIHVADRLTASSVRTVVSAASMRTGNSARDTAVQSAGFLDSIRYPDIIFASTGLEQVDRTWVLHGALTVQSTIRPLDLVVTQVRMEGTRLRAVATCDVDRYEFGIVASKGLAGRHLAMRLDVTGDRR